MIGLFAPVLWPVALGLGIVCGLAKLIDYLVFELKYYLSNQKNQMKSSIPTEAKLVAFVLIVFIVSVIMTLLTK